ncbi:ABC transporter substrate-binding protein [Microbacterium sp. HD4P20]|uniref:ABC transporter substrate-binding protein n=1 Tax=Microbacterium sp. HD4P20 TaxID=2864874 RepID=UPI001C641C82|nr:ABC transporter substrate-binding protein [Microbacterium sp. HD4P20]MCP2635838.1 ABC transporter substrate-binding protein [Microbacterium sp. HD4P20]
MRRLFSVIAGGAVAVALAGCTAQSSPDTGAAGEVTIDFWHGYTEADGEVLDSLVEEFNASQDGIRITPTTKPWATILDTVLPALTSGTGPQLLALPPENIPVYASQGALRPLDEWYDTPGSGADSLGEQAVATGIVEGERFGAPLSFTPLTMFYNRTLFEAAGLQPPTTWDEWVDAARTLTVDADGDGTPEQYGLALADHATVGNGVWVSLLQSGGGDVVTPEGDVVIDSPENLATLEFWADAVRNDKISPVGLSGVDSDGLFSSGKAAMTLAGPWMASISESSGIDYGIATLPAGPDGIRASALAVDLTATSQATDQEVAAIGEFLTWFYEKRNMVTWSLASGWPPLTTDVTADEVAENPVVESLTEQSQYGVALLPGVIPQTDILAELDAVTQKTLAGEDPAALLDSAQATMTDILAD